MRSLPRPPALFVVATYLLLSATPFLPLLRGQPMTEVVLTIALELLAWISVWAVVSRPVRFHWLLLPAFLLIPVECYLNLFYNQGISTHHLGIILETSPREAMEFLGSRIWLLLAIYIAVTAWWLAAWRAAALSPELAWTGASRRTTLVLLCVVFSVWLYGEEFGVNDKMTPGAHVTGSTLPMLPGWAKVGIDRSSFGNTWPFGLALRGHELWKERRRLSELAASSMQFRFGAVQAHAEDRPQVVVMVVGESSRFDRWSLNGYARETNPLLKQEANLVSLADVVTAVSATRLSVPVLVSRKPARQSLQPGFPEKSFLSAFREAGFKTWWLSNQMTFGQFDTPVSVFANEADVTLFLNLGGIGSRSSYDEVLLEPLQAALADRAPKKLIVLHTMGNHWNYSHRYPKEFDRWQPSLFDVANPAYSDRAIKEPLNNSYDNSILYTDWFLSRVIGALKPSQQLATMMYVADHGQTLYDGTCTLAFHGHNTQYEFHVPALIWYSDLYKATHPAKVNELLRNRRARLSTENVFHSLLDLADIRYSGEQLEWSFLSPAFKRHKRYVDSYGWTDYDNAGFKGDCREVIDNGTPLKQEK